MPSARELLEQADALMRKNRTRGDGDIPLLTDAVEVAIVPISAPPPVSAPPRMAVAAPVDVPLLTDAVADIVLDFEPMPTPAAALGRIMEGDPSDWLVMDTIDPASHSITGRAPDTLAVVPPVTLKAAGSAATPPPMGSQPRAAAPALRESPRIVPPPMVPSATSPTFAMSAIPSAAPAIPPATSETSVAAIEPISAAAMVASAVLVPGQVAAAPAPAPVSAAQPDPDNEPATEPASVPTLEPPAIAVTGTTPATADQELWRALAEQVSMQVLQRLDLFTDTGLKEQLAQRLEPIVARASAELVGAITEHVGLLVRTYVSEAIEREIAQWKRDQQ